MVAARGQEEIRAQAGLLIVLGMEHVHILQLHTHELIQKEGQISRTLKAEFTNDGFKLMGRGYSAWAEILKPYLNE